MRTKRSVTLVLFALALLGSLLPASAQAGRALLSKEALQTVMEKPQNPGEKEVLIPPPDGEIEAACGLAFSGETLYVSDYYHAQVYSYARPLQFPKERYGYGSSTAVGTDPEGPCQLAVGPAGALYANVYHQSALRIAPTPKTFDIASPTGVATDAAGNVYVNDRTQVNVYSSAGALLQEVGKTNLKDAYGLAVSGKEVFVADADTDAVKVFEPSVDPVNPKRTIEGSTPQKPFVSLIDAALAIDPTNGNLLVLDNLQPGFEHPHAAIDEFDKAGAFLGQLKDQVIDAGPSGMAVDPATGELFVTSGNSEGSNAFAWSAYSEGGGEAAAKEPEPASGSPEATSAPTTETAPATLSIAASPARAQNPAANAKHRKPRHRHRKAGQRR